jgi:hypothetical protein
MGGGGKSQTSTQTVSIPPDVLARYNSVNAQAQAAAATPFQPYTGEFVAPVNATQQAGVDATSAAAGQAQPYYGAATQQLGQAQNLGQGYLGAATGAAMAGAMPVNPGGLNVGRYMNPYTQGVVNSTEAALGQQFGQQNAAQQAQAIQAGAFGGERAGLQQAQLAGQQALAESQAISPLYQANYNQALSTAQQQQGVNLAAQQANRQAVQGLGTTLAGLGQQGYTQGAGTANALAGLGTGAQAAALQGAQAQIGAGTLGQQTQQAQDTAQYQQYLQQQGYPFQVSQFLANIAEGTGALSGSTTTSTQPSSFFSDERLKYDKHKIGKTKSGLPIYSFKYKGDNRTQVGLMAQDVEKVHPEAVGESQGYKTVDYEKALRPHRAYGGGIMPADNSMGGVVHEPGAFARGGYAIGGEINPNDMLALLAQQQKSFGPFAQQGLYGGSSAGMPAGAGGAGVVPQQQMHVSHLMTAGNLPKPPQSTMSTISDEYSKLNSIANDMTGTSLSKRAGNKLFGTDSVPAQQNSQGQQTAAAQPAAPGLVQQGWDALTGSSSNQPTAMGGTGSDSAVPPSSGPYARGGGIMPRHYADGGDVEPYDLTTPSKGYVDPSVDEGDAEKNRSLAVAGKAPGAGPSGASQLSSALGLADTAVNVGSDIMDILPMFAKRGGVVPRHHYADGGGDQGGGTSGIGAAITPEQLKALSTDTGDDTASGTSDILGGVKPQQAATGSDAANQYMDYLVNQKGLDTHVAAGMLGNAYHESAGLQPNIIGDKGRALGLFQFDVGGERPVFNKWAAQNNRDITDPYAQMDFTTERLQGPYSNTLQAMQASKDPAAAAAVFMHGYERPKAGPTEALPQRMAYANAIANGDPLPTISAYTGSQPGAAGAPASQAIQDATSGQPSSGSAKDTGFFGGLGMNKQTIVPILEGLAGMAGSKSRYLGSAILEGLGAGAKSYGEQQVQQAGLESTQAQTQGVQAATQSTLSNIAKSAGIYGPDGRLTGYKVYVNGRITTVPVDEYRRAFLAGTPYQVAPEVGGMGGTNAPAPSGAQFNPSGVGSTAIPPAQNAVQALQPGVRYDAQAHADALNDANSVNISPEESRAIKANIGTAAAAASANNGTMNALTKNTAALIGNTVAGTGSQADTRAKLLSTANMIYRTISGNNLPEGYDGSDIEINKKIQTYLAGLQTSSVNQNNAGAFVSALKGVPNANLTPKALASIGSVVVLNNSRNQELQPFANQYGNDANGNLSANVYTEYNRLHGRQMQNEETNLTNLFLSAPKAVQKIASGEIPYEAAQQMLQKMYPNTPDLVRHITQR